MSAPKNRMHAPISNIQKRERTFSIPARSLPRLTVTRSLNQFHSLSIAGDLWSKRKSDDAGVKTSYRAAKPWGVGENGDVSIGEVTVGTKIFMVQIVFRTGPTISESSEYVLPLQ